MAKAKKPLVVVTRKLPDRVETRMRELFDAQLNLDDRPMSQADLAEAVKTAIINKRAGGMGLISGRKAFQRPMAEGVKLLNAIQDVYLCKEVTVA